MKVVTQQNDMVDALCRRVYGTERATTEAVYAANPGLAARGPMLPAGITITVPDLPGPKPGATVATQNLWD